MQSFHFEIPVRVCVNILVFFLIASNFLYAFPILSHLDLFPSLIVISVFSKTITQYGDWLAKLGELNVLWVNVAKDNIYATSGLVLSNVSSNSG